MLEGINWGAVVLAVAGTASFFFAGIEVRRLRIERKWRDKVVETETLSLDDEIRQLLESA